LSSHEDHTIQSCPEFFSLTAKERRRRMKKLSCFTCFSRGGPCHDYQCGRTREVPLDTVCRACLETTRAGESAPSHLLCGLSHHVKPNEEELVRAFESWIPQLNLRPPIPEMCINPATSGVNRAAPTPRRIAIGPELATCNTVTMPKPQTVTRPATLPLTHITTATDPSTQKEPEIIDVRNVPLGVASGMQAFTRIQTGKLILPCLALVNDKEAWTLPVPDSC
jgi:hypothetical protein